MVNGGNKINHPRNDRKGEAFREKFFHRVLLDACREFKNAGSIDLLAEIYLLSAMGATGVREGFVFVMDRNSLSETWISRGLSPRDRSLLKTRSRSMAQSRFKQLLHESPVLPFRIAESSGELRPNSEFHPGNASILLKWSLGDKYIGLTGLGDRLTGRAADSTEKAFIEEITRFFLFFLRDLKISGIVREYEEKMERGRAELLEAHRTIEHQKRVMDRKEYHLKSFSDIYQELGGLSDIREIIEAYLLMVLGIFSIDKGFMLFLDRGETSIRTARANVDLKAFEHGPPEHLDGIVAIFFEHARLNKMAPMTVRMVDAAAIPGTSLIPMDVKTCLMFMVDENSMGVIGLGNKITGERFSDSEKEHFLSISSNVAVFLKNARGLETIRKLNRDLENRNIELKKTIDDLGAYKRKTEVLELAKAHIKSILRYEAERTGKLSAMDFLLIVFAGIALGLIFNLANPAGVSVTPKEWSYPAIPAVDARTARSRVDSMGALVVDARPVEFFNAEHIAGAWNLPPALFDFVYMMRFSSLPIDKEILVYGRNISRHYDSEVAHKLSLRGHRNVSLVRGGLEGWRRNNYPVESEAGG